MRHLTNTVSRVTFVRGWTARGGGSDPMSGYSLLTGVRVLEVAQLAPSSVGGHLADLGAEVIKVETGSGDGVRAGGAAAVGRPDGPAFMHLRWNRGKQSAALDLR